MIHLGEEEVGHMGTEDRAKWERGIKLAAVDASGSSSTWQLLSDADQDHHFQLERDRQLRELGNSAFTALPPKAQRGIILFVWVGCCMHKDLNCVKGGAVALAKFWDAHNLPGPHRFFNKDNDATVSLAGNPAAPTAAEQRAVRVSERGGIKLCALTGSLLNNKDDKKGYHDTHVWCFKLWFGVSKRFADTSNTRFGSYVDASTEIYVRKDGFIRLLEHVRDKKGSGTFNHLESNVYAGLHDIPCLTELAVIALYGQAISRPYMRAVRLSGPEELNMLKLGPLHHRVKDHITNLIDNLLLSPHPLAETGALDGRPWYNLELFDVLAETSLNLPHLRGALLAFLTGALETWQWFTSEFDEEGVIATLTSEETTCAFLPATNDANEGLLGTWRVWRRRFPSLSELQFNARMMIRLNGTEDFMEQELTSGQEELIRRNARDPALARVERQRKEAIVAVQAETATKNREARENREQKRKERQNLANQVTLELDESKINLMKGPQLKEQLTKHRILGDEERLCHGYKRKAGEKTPSSMLVAELRAFLIEIVGRFKTRQAGGVVARGDEIEQDDEAGSSSEDE